jgi:hypothetical protein
VGVGGGISCGDNGCQVTCEWEETFMRERECDVSLMCGDVSENSSHRTPKAYKNTCP